MAGPFLAVAAVAAVISAFGRYKGSKNRGDGGAAERQHKYNLEYHQWSIDNQRRTEQRRVDDYNKGVDFYNEQETERVRSQNAQASAHNTFMEWQSKEIDQRNRSQVKILELQASFVDRSKYSENALLRLNMAKGINRVAAKGFELKSSLDNMYAVGGRSGFNVSKGNSAGLAATEMIRNGMFSVAADLIDMSTSKSASDEKLASLKTKGDELNVTRDSYFDENKNFKKQQFEKVELSKATLRSHIGYQNDLTAPPLPVIGATQPTGYSTASKLQFAGDLLNSGNRMGVFG